MFDVGRHEVQVLSTALSISQKSGAQQIVVQFENDQQDTITAYLSCSDAAWQYTEEKLRAIGWNPVDHGYRFEELNQEPSPCAGNQCQITIQQEEYEGRKRLKVGFINPPGGLPVERMEQAEAQAFAAQLRARLLGQPQAATSTTSKRPTVPPKRSAQSTDADGDIPF
jgi:hypothetical protein